MLFIIVSLLIISNVFALYNRYNIDELESIYNQLIIVENKIYETSFVNLEHFELAKNISSNALVKKRLNLHLDTYFKNALVKNIPLEHNQEYIKLLGQLEKYNSELENIIEKQINQIYNKYINVKLVGLEQQELGSTKNFIPRLFDISNIVDYDIRILQIINYNQEQKRIFKELLKKYNFNNILDVKKMLTNLYLKKISENKKY